jgi:hypothetical protein
MLHVLPKARSSALAFAIAFVAASLTPSPAAAITCDMIPNALNPNAPTPPVVYVQASTSAGPFIAPLQQALSVDPNPVTVVFVSNGGCTGVNNFFTSQPIVSKKKSVYYVGTVSSNCDVPMTGGPNGGPPVADLIVSDVYPATCGALPGGQLPPYAADFLGPIQTEVFAVPKASSQKAISAAAAYFVFGFGGNSAVTPWTTNTSIYRNNSSSSSQALLSVALGIPISQWAGVDVTTLPVNAGIAGAQGAQELNAMVVDPNPEAAIGYLAYTNVDAPTATRVNVLAYKEKGQSCAYYPDSTPTAHDKVNVRDGHYSLWGPTHYITFVDGHGEPQNPNVARLISYVTGTTSPPGGLDLLQLEAQMNLVPPCAMHVARAVEMGPLVSYAPPNSCSCYYDYVATGKSSCQECMKSLDCPASAPICNQSYPISFCETQ